MTRARRLSYPHYSSVTLYPAVGAYISVSGVSPSAFNGTFLVTAGSATSVSYCITSSPGTYSSGGHIGLITYTTYDADGQAAVITTADGISKTYTRRFTLVHPSGLPLA